MKRKPNKKRKSNKYPKVFYLLSWVSKEYITFPSAFKVEDIGNNELRIYSARSYYYIVYRKSFDDWKEERGGLYKIILANEAVLMDEFKDLI